MLRLVRTNDQKKLEETNQHETNSKTDGTVEGEKENLGEMAAPPSDTTDWIGPTLFSLKSRYILFLFLKNKHYKKKSE